MSRINKMWKNGTGRYGDSDFYSFTHDLPNVEGELVTLYEKPGFRYLDFDKKQIGRVKLYSDVLRVNRKDRTAKRSFGERSKSHVFPFTVITATEAAEKMARYQEMADQEKKRAERKAKESAARRRMAFLNAQKTPLKIGDYACSKDNVVGAVEVVGEGRVKLSTIGEVRFKPEYFLFQNLDHFNINQSNYGHVFWANKNAFAPCNGLQIH